MIFPGHWGSNILLPNAIFLPNATGEKIGKHDKDENKSNDYGFQKKCSLEFTMLYAKLCSFVVLNNFSFIWYIFVSGLSTVYFSVLFRYEQPSKFLAIRAIRKTTWTKIWINN